LYDLHNDPEEIKNIFDAPEASALKASLVEKMLRRLIEFQDRSPLPAYRA